MIVHVWLTNTHVCARCRYVHEISLLSTLLEMAPTLLLLGATYWYV